MHPNRRAFPGSSANSSTEPSKGRAVTRPSPTVDSPARVRAARAMSRSPSRRGRWSPIGSISGGPCRTCSTSSPSSLGLSASRILPPGRSASLLPSSIPRERIDRSCFEPGPRNPFSDGTVAGSLHAKCSDGPTCLSDHGAYPTCWAVRRRMRSHGFSRLAVARRRGATYQRRPGDRPRIDAPRPPRSPAFRDGEAPPRRGPDLIRSRSIDSYFLDSSYRPRGGIP